VTSPQGKATAVHDLLFTAVIAGAVIAVMAAIAALITFFAGSPPGNSPSLVTTGNAPPAVIYPDPGLYGWMPPMARDHDRFTTFITDHPLIAAVVAMVIVIGLAQTVAEKLWLTLRGALVLLGYIGGIAGGVTAVFFFWGPVVGLLTIITLLLLGILLGIFIFLMGAITR
jgi:hypothetical protein